MISGDEVGDAIRLTLPDGIVFAGGLIVHGQSELFDEEREALSQAAPKRRREFRAGRTYGRTALGALGFRPGPILVGPERAPLWPSGAVASISHCDSYCGVIAARAEAYAGVGLDIESAAPLAENVVSLICSDPELQDRSETESHLGIDLPKLIFSMKECVYKSYATVTRCFLEFADLHIVVDPDRRSFVGHLVNDDRPSAEASRTFRGTFLTIGGLVIAWTAMPRNHAG
jgi:4'-phosphopantetheinyl transferase EntD